MSDADVDAVAILKLVEQARKVASTKQATWSSMDLLMHAYFFEASACGYDVRLKVTARKAKPKAKRK